MSLTEIPGSPAVYDKAHFIAKFEAIHEDFWCAGRFEDDDGAKCARGHCGATVFRMHTPENDALYDLFPGILSPQFINDGLDKRYQQPTPKQRVLAALRDLP